MASRIKEIGTVCRFCLRREGLMPLSKATRTAFAIKDVIRCTGIMISCNRLPYAICDECCTTIKKAVNFRLTCLRKDVIFKQLVRMLGGISMDNRATKESRAADSSPVFNLNSQYAAGDTHFEGAGSFDTPIITLDDSDSDDNRSVLGSQVSTDTIAPRTIVQREKLPFGDRVQVQHNKQVTRDIKNASSTQHSNLGTSDCDASDDSLPSLYSEVMQRDVNEKLKAESSACPLTRPTEDSAKEHDSAPASVENNLISAYGSDSDDSMPSLYGDAMAEARKEQKNKGSTTSTGGPNVVAKKKYELCSLCGFFTCYLGNHIKRRHNMVKKVTCPQCPRKFVGRFDLLRHMNTSHEKRIILTCEHCGKGFVNHSSHFYHMKNSHGESDQYECETCHRKFKSIDGYRKHLKEHSLTSHPCPECGKLFKTPRTLEKHQIRYHPS